MKCLLLALLTGGQAPSCKHQGIGHFFVVVGFPKTLLEVRIMDGCRIETRTGRVKNDVVQSLLFELSVLLLLLLVLAHFSGCVCERAAAD